MTNEQERALNTSFTAEDTDLNPEDFSALLDKYDYHFSPGQIVAGTVFSLEPRGALIDIGARTAAYLPIQEMSANKIESPEEVLQPNETREFFILTDENEDGQLTLSIRRIEYMRAWERLRQMQAEDVTIHATIFETNRGGALARVEGLRGFIPGSHISISKPKEKLIGEELPLKFLEVDEERNRLVLSHRRALVERKMNRLEVGEVVDGVVRGIKSYGVFVDIGGVSALLINSEISHTNVEDPNNIFQINDTIKAVIIDLDAERGRISISTKALELRPGGMLRNPQQVYEHAEAAAAIYLNSIQSRINRDNAEEIISYELTPQETNQEEFPEEWAAFQVKLANAYLNRTLGDRSENLEQSIAACQSALQIYTHETFPEKWARTQTLLAKAYSERIKGDRAENIEQAITSAQLSMQVYTRDAFPEEWARAQNSLANAYANRVRGDYTNNLEKAITNYQLTLQVYTREAFPEEWGKTQIVLAKAYSKRTHSKSTENNERVITACTLALQVFTCENFPKEWAETQNILAKAYFERIRGDRTENIERAIDCYQQALTVTTQIEMPLEWATIIRNLANAYSNRIRGNRAENIEQAIDCYQQALTVITQVSMPVEWAIIMHNLAIAYSNRIRGDRADNIEQSIEFYQQALTVTTQSAMPVDWATTMMNLGVAYKNRIRGDRAENIEQAIEVCNQALTVITQSAIPAGWAATMVNLASAYSKRIRGDRSENIEQTIAACESALQVYTRETFPKEWAETHNVLAAAYSERIWGDRSDNLEQAIAACQSALRIYTREAFPEKWAETQTVLAKAYSERIRGDRATNLEQAIEAYQQALTVSTEAAMPLDWANALMNLATAYASRITGDRAENLEQAINAYQQALTVLTKAAMPLQWATIMNDLAKAYFERIEGDRAENIEKAINCFEQALTVRTRRTMPIDWAQSSKDLALAYVSRIRGDRIHNLEEAISSYQQALKVYTPNAFPERYVEIQNELGKVFEEQQHYEKAIASYDQAIAIKPDSAEVWTNRGNALYKLGQYEEAIASYDQAIVFQPDLSRAWDNRGEALDKLGRHEEAIESYDQALHYKPDDHLVWYNKGNALCGLGRYEEAIESCDRAIQLKPDYPEAWHNRGNTLSYLGRYEEAMASYDKAIQFKPDLAEAWHNRGLVLSYLDRYEEALSSYNKTLELKPDFAQVWSNRGEVLRELQQFNDSLANFNRAVELQPDYIEAIVNRGETYQLLKRYEEALVDFNFAIELEPDYVWAIAQRGEIYRLMECPTEAIQDFTHAFELDSNNAWIIAQRGQALASLNHYEEARQDYEQAIAICREKGDLKNEAICLINLGNTYQDLSESQQAIEYFQRSLGISQDIGDVHNRAIALDSLGRVHASIEEHLLAIEYYQQALDLYKTVGDRFNESLVLVDLADAYQVLENYQQAIDFYEQALAISQELGDLESVVLAQSRLTQSLLQVEDFERAITVTQSISDQKKRLEVLTGVVEEVRRLGDDWAEELLSPFQSDRDEQIRQLINGVLEPISRESRLVEYRNLAEFLQACTVKLSISGQAGWGTGCFISPGLILTCAFVVDQADSGPINVLWQGKSYTAEISAKEARGIAVLRLWPQISLEHPCIYLSEVDEDSQPGDRLYTYGYPDSLPNGSSVTFECEGFTGSDPPILKFKAGQVRPGLSGAPLLNLRTGKVCGIVRATRDRSIDLGGDAIPAEIILQSSPDLERWHRLFHERNKTWTNLLPQKQNELSRLQTQQALIERLKSCTVKVRIPNQSGWRTGYLVQPDLILTFNFRQNQTENNLVEVDWVQQELLETATVEVVLADSRLALLRILDPLFEEITPVDLDTDNAELDDDFYSYGYSDSEENGCPVTFRCAGFSRDNNNLPILNLIEGQIRPGMNGAPVLNLRTGKIAGLITYTNDRSFAAGGGAIPSTYILSQIPQLTQSDHQFSRLQNAATQDLSYCVFLRSIQKSVLLGSELEVAVSLTPFIENQPDAYLLEIASNDSLGNELNILISAPGFKFEGDNATSLPLDPTVNTQQTSQTTSFCLTALRSGTNTITAEIYRGDTFETTLQTTVQVAAPEESELPDIGIKAQPRPVSQPDLVFQVQAQWDETASTSTFHYQLRSFRNTPLLSRGVSYTSQPLPRSWLEQVQNLLAAHLQTLSGSLLEDGYSQLISLGQYLFQSLFPIELQTDLRTLNRYQSITLLLQTAQEAQFPWSLLHNGQEFLGERFIIGQWLWDLNNHRPHEFPVGAINLVHYANVEQPETWATLLEPPGAPPPFILPGGMLEADLSSIEAMRGLHLLRFGQSLEEIDRRDAPVPLDTSGTIQDLEQKVRPVKLNLRRNRPLVTLGYLRQDQPELTSLEKTWAPTFLRAGCSAFVGSLWAVRPETEAAFISTFYHALWKGDSLGGAFQAARKVARATLPESIDWLAYVLFGDPMARPYRPIQGQGYAVVEPIGQEIDDPVSPGTTVRFRVSLRRTPPVWHEERVIEVAENLSFNDLQAHIVTFGLQITPATSVSLSVTPSGNYIGWFNLTIPPDLTGESTLVQVYFADGMQTIHTLTFPLKIAQAAGG